MDQLSFSQEEIKPRERHFGPRFHIAKLEGRAFWLGGLHFKATQADIERHVRRRVYPIDCQFHWSTKEGSNWPENEHPGFCMVECRDAAIADLARTVLTNFDVLGRPARTGILKEHNLLRDSRISGGENISSPAALKTFCITSPHNFGVTAEIDGVHSIVEALDHESAAKLPVLTPCRPLSAAAERIALEAMVYALALEEKRMVEGTVAKSKYLEAQRSMSTGTVPGLTDSRYPVMRRFNMSPLGEIIEISEAYLPSTTVSAKSGTTGRTSLVWGSWTLPSPPTTLAPMSPKATPSLTAGSLNPTAEEFCPLK